MLKASRVILTVVVFSFLVWAGSSSGKEPSAKSENIPVKGMVTMVDLGAKACIPCKMMAPILEKMEKKYRGKAAVIFIDVWKDPAQAKKFRIRAIPTQIFFDKDGREVYRHTGFMSEKDIDRTFAKMGVN